MKWLVAVVVNAMDDLLWRNYTCLVLTGEQGKFKTTFLDLLCPEELKSYLFTGKIDPQGKDVQTLIAEYLFINIDDQLKALNKRDENELKNLITTSRVKYRRPYDTYIKECSHLASFNYWFNEEEIAELHQESEGFQVQTVENEMLLKGMEKPAVTEESYMTTSEILNYLRAYITLNPSERRMGEALKKAGFLRKSKRIGGNPMYVYHIRKIVPNPFIQSYNTNY